MKRGPIVHGVLLLVVLVLSYRAWTAEKKVEPKTGDVVVWSKPIDKVTAVVYETKDRTVRIDRKKDDKGAYWWGSETRVSKVRPPRKADAPPDAPPPQEEMKTTEREFPVDDRGEEAVKNLAELRALRSLGQLDDDEKKKDGLTDSTDNITVTFDGGETRSLILGGRIYGGADRWVVNTTTGNAYAIAGSLIAPLHGGESGMNLRKIHTFEPDDVATVDLEAMTGKGKKRTFQSTETETEQGKKKGWADSRTPDKPDQTLANFLSRIETGTRPTEYVKQSDIEKAEQMKKVLAVSYKDAKGTQMGTFELYKLEVPAEPPPEPPAADATKPGDAAKPADATKPGDAAKPADATKPGDEAKPPEPPKPAPPDVTYYIKTERTRIYGKIGKSLGDLILKDLDQL